MTSERLKSFWWKPILTMRGQSLVVLPSLFLDFHIPVSVGEANSLSDSGKKSKKKPASVAEPAPKYSKTRETPSRGIGLLAEQGLHAALKQAYAKPGDRFEQAVDGKVIDVVRKNGDLVEIQTGNFGKIRVKIRALAARHPVLVVHPIVVKKTIVVLEPTTGTVLSRRSSPKHENPLSAFEELVYFPDLLSLPGAELELALVEVEEIRLKNGKRGWRQRDKVLDRRLVGLGGKIRLKEASDIKKILPCRLPKEFTTPELAKLFGIGPRQAGKVAYCLKLMGAVRQEGKKGRAYRYVR
jgi:hypothetical protein